MVHSIATLVVVSTPLVLGLVHELLRRGRKNKRGTGKRS
jgi:hypothetical protein